MDESEDLRIRRKNGQIVMDALKTLQEPATLTNVVRYVAETQQLSPSLIKEPIKEVLMKGVEYGFLQKFGAKYSVDSPDSNGSDDNEEEEADDGDDDQLEDRSRRRGRRGRGRSRKRGRSRSRSRRRRR